MFFEKERKILQDVQNETSLAMSEKPKILSAGNFVAFCGELRYAFRLVAEEKEIIVFAVFQWIAIGIAYLLWIQVLDWIPDSIWEEVRRSIDRDDDGAFTLINLFLLGWSFLVVAAVSYPISLFSAAMVAAHNLRHAGQISTVGRCLGLAYTNLGKLWIFTTIDAWITVNAIVDRLPRKNHKRTSADELLYYAWKLGTVGVFPALMAGKGFGDAAKDSLLVLTKRPTRAIGIRMGYSLICWVIGISAYAGAVYYFSVFGDRSDKVNEVFNFYLLMAVPIVIAVGVTTVLVRPFYLIMIASLYTDVVPVAKTETESNTRVEGGEGLGLLFAVLIGLIIGAILFGEVLGLKEWIDSLAVRDIHEYRRMNP